MKPRTQIYRQSIYLGLPNKYDALLSAMVLVKLITTIRPEHLLYIKRREFIEDLIDFN